MNLSQLPEIKKKTSAPDPMLHSSNLSSKSVIDELTSISEDISTSTAGKRRLKSLISRLQEDLHSHTSFSPTSRSSIRHGSRLQAAFSEMLNGEFFMRQRTYQGNNAKTRMIFDIASSNHNTSTSGSPRVFKRTNPATQPPSETFGEMNEIMMFSLCLVNVAEIEFDIHNVRELDGTVMQDPERLFLSVCCSVFANFAFVKLLDLKKLMKFFSSIYNLYTNSNPYRNYLHAADSLQMLSLFFRDPAVNFLFTDEEILLSFLSVLALDISHIGLHNSSLAVIDHNLVKVFGPSQTTEHCALLVFLHELFHEGNFFLSTMYNGSSAMVLGLVRESICATVLGTCESRRMFLLYELERIGLSGVVRHCDIPYIITALVLLASNGFVFRQRVQCFRFGNALRSELKREAGEMAKRKIEFAIPSECLESMLTFVPDYCASVVRNIVEAIRAFVPVDLHDNFVHNCEVPPPEEMDLLTRQRTGEPYSPWIDDSENVIEILLNASTFAHSLNREVSKMAILNASPPRNYSAFDGHHPSSPTEARSGSDFGGMEDSQSSFTVGGSRCCKPEHCFLFLQLYNNYELEGKGLDEFLGQLVFLAIQLDPLYLSQEARMLFIPPEETPDYVGLAKYIMHHEEAPPTAERLVSRSRPQTPTSKTDGFVLQLMEMYYRRTLKPEGGSELEEEETGMPSQDDTASEFQSGYHLSPIDFPPSVHTPGRDTPTRRSVCCIDV